MRNVSLVDGEHLRVESSTMSSLVAAKDSLDPSHNFVRRGVSGLVQVEESRRDVVRDITLERRTTLRQRCVVAASHIQIVEVLQQKTSHPVEIPHTIPSEAVATEKFRAWPHRWKERS